VDKWNKTSKTWTLKEKETIRGGGQYFFERKFVYARLRTKVRKDVG